MTELQSDALQEVHSDWPMACTLDGRAWEARRPQAAVLVADRRASPRFCWVAGQHLPLHPGEVAFPGGKREPEDASPWVTAQREPARRSVSLLTGPSAG